MTKARQGDINLLEKSWGKGWGWGVGCWRDECCGNGGGAIRIPSSLSLQTLPCRFKAYKGGSLDCSFSPLLLLHSHPSSPSFCSANWRQVAPRCGAQVTVTLMVRSAARLHAAGYSSKWRGGASGDVGHGSRGAEYAVGGNERPRQLPKRVTNHPPWPNPPRGKMMDQWSQYVAAEIHRLDKSNMEAHLE